MRYLREQPNKKKRRLLAFVWSCHFARKLNKIVFQKLSNKKKELFISVFLFVAYERKNQKGVFNIFFIFYWPLLSRSHFLVRKWNFFNMSVLFMNITIIAYPYYTTYICNWFIQIQKKKQILSFKKKKKRKYLHRKAGRVFVVYDVLANKTLAFSKTRNSIKF